mmetsp:Transcript_23248/g.33327  ORF Transcript_23248/g.33327 Transcript_23248/m.33327 type:complete len:232 (+) Transcript_23248:2731-3426(+)
MCTKCSLRSSRISLLCVRTAVNSPDSGLISTLPNTTAYSTRGFQRESDRPWKRCVSSSTFCTFKQVVSASLCTMIAFVPTGTNGRICSLSAIWFSRLICASFFKTFCSVRSLLDSFASLDTSSSGAVSSSFFASTNISASDIAPLPPSRSCLPFLIKKAPKDFSTSSFDSSKFLLFNRFKTIPNVAANVEFKASTSWLIMLYAVSAPSNWDLRNTQVPLLSLPLRPARPAI